MWTLVYYRYLLFVIYFANNSSMLQMSFSFVFVFSPPFICGGGRGGLVAELCSTLVTPRTAACQPPLSVQFPRQEYWSVLPFPSSGHLPDAGIKPLQLGKWIFYHWALGARQLESSHLLSIWPPDLLIFGVVARPSNVPGILQTRDSLFRIISNLLLESGMGCEL